MTLKQYAFTARADADGNITRSIPPTLGVPAIQIRSIFVRFGTEDSLGFHMNLTDATGYEFYDGDQSGVTNQSFAMDSGYGVPLLAPVKMRITGADPGAYEVHVSYIPLSILKMSVKVVGGEVLKVVAPSGGRGKMIQLRGLRVREHNGATNDVQIDVISDEHEAIVDGAEDTTPVDLRYADDDAQAQPFITPWTYILSNVEADGVYDCELYYT